MNQSGVALVVQSCVVTNPQGYGRIVRNSAGRPVAIREHRDLRDDSERAIKEVNAGIYIGRRELLSAALQRLVPNNDQSELYLTDVVADISGTSAVAAVPGNPDSLVGVNDRVQLDEAEVALYERIARRHAMAGVTVRSGARIEDCVTIEQEAVIETGVVLRGTTCVGSGTLIDVGCVVTDSRIGRDARVKPHSVIERSLVGNGAQIGPLAHLSPESVIDEDAHIGSFVETK
jgi:bifunctional UDP-N-acetylglucosamine pyrophosphorylase/glucosamine-1-phosphate N-acetyltransferase